MNDSKCNARPQTRSGTMRRPLGIFRLSLFPAQHRLAPGFFSAGGSIETSFPRYRPHSSPILSLSFFRFFCFSPVYALSRSPPLFLPVFRLFSGARRGQRVPRCRPARFRFLFCLSFFYSGRVPGWRSSNPRDLSSVPNTRARDHVGINSRGNAANGEPRARNAMVFRFLWLFG